MQYFTQLLLDTFRLIWYYIFKAPNGSNLIIRYMHMRSMAVSDGGVSRAADYVSASDPLGETGNTGGVQPHFHMDVNAHNITSGTVYGSGSVDVGQNPAAFFPDIAPDEWKYKNPHGWAYCGYQE